MKFLHGWHCPDLLSGPGNYLNKNQDAELALAHLTGARTAVQAGGHIGTWPVYLAARFARVLTFEPEPENFAALELNLADRGLTNVTARRAVLAHKAREHRLRVSPKSTGQHRIGRGIPVEGTTIDDLRLDDLDAIFLDVEGYELAALRGAVKTIARTHPVIMAEENKRALDQGFQLGDVGRLLIPLGYRKVAEINEDLVFAWAPQNENHPRVP